jgi:FkbM family methyltransferase
MVEDLVYDVGMNNGDDTAHYLYKGFRVVSIEADPTLVEAARRRFEAEIAGGRLTLLNLAIGADEGLAPFWISEGKSIWNSFDRSSACRMGQTAHAIEVRCRRFRNVLSEYGVPYYLKIDIEGNDRYCLDDLDRADMPKYISLELSSMNDLFALRALGYDRFKIITQHDFTQLPIQPFTLRELVKRCLRTYPAVFRAARAVVSLTGQLGGTLSREKSSSTPGTSRYRHPLHSSGPFAEETDGEWQRFEDVAYTWLNYQLGYSQYGTPCVDVWHDVHATRG